MQIHYLALSLSVSSYGGHLATHATWYGTSCVRFDYFFYILIPHCTQSCICFFILFIKWESSQTKTKYAIKSIESYIFVTYYNKTQSKFTPLIRIIYVKKMPCIQKLSKACYIFLRLIAWKRNAIFDIISYRVTFYCIKILNCYVQFI